MPRSRSKPKPTRRRSRSAGRNKPKLAHRRSRRSGSRGTRYRARDGNRVKEVMSVNSSDELAPQIRTNMLGQEAKLKEIEIHGDTGTINIVKHVSASGPFLDVYRKQDSMSERLFHVHKDTNFVEALKDALGSVKYVDEYVFWITFEDETAKVVPAIVYYGVRDREGDHVRSLPYDIHIKGPITPGVPVLAKKSRFDMFSKPIIELLTIEYMEWKKPVILPLGEALHIFGKKQRATPDEIQTMS